MSCDFGNFCGFALLEIFILFLPIMFYANLFIFSISCNLKLMVLKELAYCHVLQSFS